MKKIKLPVAIIGGLLLLSLVFGAGVYASQWLNFTGDEQIEQSENDVDEIMQILRDVNTDKLTAEQALAELQELNPSGLAKQNQELREQIEQLENTNDQLATQLEQKQAEIEQKIAEIQEKIDEGNRKVAEKQAELDIVAQERDTNKQRADQLQQQIDENSNYVAHLEQELQRANEKVQSVSNKTTKAVEEARTYK